MPLVYVPIVYVVVTPAPTFAGMMIKRRVGELTLP